MFCLLCFLHFCSLKVCITVVQCFVQHMFRSPGALVFKKKISSWICWLRDLSLTILWSTVFVLHSPKVVYQRGYTQGILYLNRASFSFHVILSGCPASRNRSKAKHQSKLGGSRMVLPSFEQILKALTLGKMLDSCFSSKCLLVAQKVCWYLKNLKGLRWWMRTKMQKQMQKDVAGCERT